MALYNKDLRTFEHFIYVLEIDTNQQFESHLINKTVYQPLRRLRSTMHHRFLPQLNLSPINLPQSWPYQTYL